MIRKEKANDRLEKTNDSPRNDDNSKEMLERQNNEMIRRKLDSREEERLVNLALIPMTTQERAQQ